MSNSIHSSFGKVRVLTYPTDGVIVATFATTGSVAIPGLIDIEITGMGYTQIKDTEQDSPGGYEQFYAGRGQPITAALTMSYSAAKQAILTRYLPKPIDQRTQPDYGNCLFEFELSKDCRVRTFGYLSIGSAGKGEDERRTITATVQGSGEPLVVYDTGAAPAFPVTSPLTYATAAQSQRPGLVPS